ncbi:hypothetical protein F0562_026214 [Nyssa sinensis]|uniref:Ataxin-2 C-terminal domain-containing protein n=1 Tax=Nyssa sinensis TaxID=561372 RepID=A0A5J5BCA1_9ASTE|nr:hypothetical protein F0562_026214 [Nyssa sinensis]
MDVISRNMPSSTLNPNAPMFVPLAYREVEDFSDQWWALVQVSPWFRDYWLQECFHDPQNDPTFPENDDHVLPDPDIDELLEETEERNYQKELISVGALKWRKPRVLAKIPRHIEKVPKIVNVKVSPRPIQQPR